MFIIENMGSMFFMILVYPAVIVILQLLKVTFQNLLRRGRAGRRILDGISSVIDAAFWNTPISFVYEAYFVICVMSFIGTQNLIFRGAELWS